MRHILIALSLFFLFSSCSQLGTCDQKEAVSFRGVKFEFPIRAYDVIKNSKNPIYRKSRWIHTDSIAANTSAIWFFDWPDNDRERRGSLDYLKGVAVYGVTFFLHDKELASDEEIVKELQKWYPGNYECVELNGMHYYILNKGCLKIIYNWASTYAKYSNWSPAISFCYGLSDSEYSAYAHHIGDTFPGEFN
ncbi:hypothetical protein [Dyadobacter bucti]|uniref:hypothetical protein n=1 Tax=Dyadobacter bucti TaxID=2572203 RepID=UPI00110980E3|nr:hypothetical protein [Dyadobacter bucti]